MHAIIFGCVCMFCVSINSINLTAAGDNLKSVTRCINTFVLMCTGQVCLFVQYSSLLVICNDVMLCSERCRLFYFQLHNLPHPTGIIVYYYDPYVPRRAWFVVHIDSDDRYIVTIT